MQRVQHERRRGRPQQRPAAGHDVQQPRDSSAKGSSSTVDTTRKDARPSASSERRPDEHACQHGVLEGVDRRAVDEAAVHVGEDAVLQTAAGPQLEDVAVAGEPVVAAGVEAGALPRGRQHDERRARREHEREGVRAPLRGRTPSVAARSRPHARPRRGTTVATRARARASRAAGGRPPAGGDDGRAAWLRVAAAAAALVVLARAARAARWSDCSARRCCRPTPPSTCRAGRRRRPATGTWSSRRGNGTTPCGTCRIAADGYRADDGSAAFFPLYPLAGAGRRDRARRRRAAGRVRRHDARAGGRADRPAPAHGARARRAAGGDARCCTSRSSRRRCSCSRRTARRCSSRCRSAACTPPGSATWLLGGPARRAGGWHAQLGGAARAAARGRGRPAGCASRPDRWRRAAAVRGRGVQVWRRRSSPLGTAAYLAWWARVDTWRRPLDVQGSTWDREPAWPWETLLAGARVGTGFLGDYPGRLPHARPRRGGRLRARRSRSG